MTERCSCVSSVLGRKYQPDSKVMSYAISIAMLELLKNRHLFFCFVLCRYNIDGGQAYSLNLCVPNFFIFICCLMFDSIPVKDT